MSESPEPQHEAQQPSTPKAQPAPQPEPLTLQPPKPPAPETPRMEPKREGTFGFTCPPDFLIDLFNMIYLNGEFNDFVLNFDGEKVWWSQLDIIIPFGFLEYKAVGGWGKGRVGISGYAKGPKGGLLKELKYMQLHIKKSTIPLTDSEKTLTFWADPELGIFGISGAFDEYTQKITPPDEIKTAILRFPHLNDEFVPQFKEESEEAQLIYGAVIDARDLNHSVDMGVSLKYAKRNKKLAARDDEFYVKYITFCLTPEPNPEIKLVFRNAKNPVINAEVNLQLKPGTIKAPSIPIKHIVERRLIKPVAESYKGLVYIRFSGVNKYVNMQANVFVYIMKLEVFGEGLLGSGVLIPTKRYEQIYRTVQDKRKQEPPATAQDTEKQKSVTPKEQEEQEPTPTAQDEKEAQ